mgnify:FL=1
MAKVYIDRDDFRSYFLWDDEVFEALGFKYSPLIEVPDEFILEYKEVMAKMQELNSKLEKFYKEGKREYS